MRNHFVDIVSVYETEEKRNLIDLAEIYRNKTKLQYFISELISRHFKTENFKNKRILLKPNWVKHSVELSDEICLRTNDDFLISLLEVVLKFEPESVLIGDAPIQGCIWEKVVTEDLISRIKVLSESYKIPIRIKDFRRVTFNPEKNNPEKDRNPLSDYIIFDLGKQSYLEPITDKEKNLFRVTNYNPDRLAESHSPGVHKYCITKELFDADIIISIPKVKTHQKTAITAALKNLVGLNGDKDYLPHHKFGGVENGGDCYPNKNILRYCSELAIDFANRRQGKLLYWIGLKLSSVLWRLSRPTNEHYLSAGWHGNDTTWRMVLDLNKIVEYGNRDGTISNEPVRQLISICDGIIGGQGDGPLKPSPLALGIISITNNSGINDMAMAELMRFESKSIPMLKAIYEKTKNATFTLEMNQKKVNLNELKLYSIETTPPPGWINFFSK